MHGRLCFRRKTRGKRSTRMKECFFVRSLMRYIGWLYKCTGSFLRKSEREKSQPSAITTPSQICPIRSVLLYEPFGGDVSLPGPPLLLRDFVFAESSTDKLYNDKWWPKHRGSMPSRDLKLSCN